MGNMFTWLSVFPLLIIQVLLQPHMITEKEEELGRCQISFCKKPPEFICERCRLTKYCNSLHQKLHWKTGHKIECMTPDQRKNHQEKMDKIKAESTITHKRKHIRKNLVNNFTSSQYEDCLALARILQDAEWTSFSKAESTSSQDEFNYGFTVCLVVKCQCFLNQIPSAKLKLSQYIKTSTFLEDIHYFQSPDQEEVMAHMEKKLELIALLANLCYTVGLEYNSLYMVYAQHISHIFGSQSIEMSNTYFLIGCNYAQQGFPIKALACFQLAAKNRVSQSDTCFFNMGIMFTWIGRTNDAIHYFNKALKMREETYGESSNEVAEIYENMGSICLSLFDFQTCNYYYEKAINIRINIKHDSYKTSPDYLRLEEMVENMFKKLCAYISSEPSEVERPDTYINFRESLLQSRKYPRNLLQKLKDIAGKSDGQDTGIPHAWKEEFKERKDKAVFKIDPDIMMKVNTKVFLDLFNKNEEDPDDRNPQKQQNQLKNRKGLKKKRILDKDKEQKREFSVLISPKIMSMITSDQLVMASQLQQRLTFVMGEKKAVEEIEKSNFAQSLTAEEMQVFRRDNNLLYSLVFEMYPDFVLTPSKNNVNQSSNKDVVAMKSVSQHMRLAKRHIQN